MKSRRSLVEGTSRRQRAVSGFTVERQGQVKTPAASSRPSRTRDKDSRSSFNGEASSERPDTKASNDLIQDDQNDGDAKLPPQDEEDIIDPESSQAVNEGEDRKAQEGKDENVRMTRKRKAMESSKKESTSSSSLMALEANGRLTTVKLILADRPYVPDSNDVTDNSSHGETLGHDGNQYYCQVCRGFGDVVCCDGCPRVYHHECVPLKSPSRMSLDNDDDPWYCPRCIDKAQKSGGRCSKGRRSDRAGGQQRCADCEENRPDLKLEPCSGCGSYVHSPSCMMVSGTTSSTAKKQRIFCSNCRAIDRLTKEEDEQHENSERMLAVHREMREEEEDYPHGDLDESLQQEYSMDEDASDDNDGKKRRAKRKKSSLSPVNDREEKKRKKKKKKKRKHSMSPADNEDPNGPAEPEQPDQFLPPKSTGIIQATPAFHFYLSENRWKVERALSRQHRYFNRLPKGNERNALVAQEAAQWWLKLRPAEVRLYINMSIRDFEQRVIEWKNEKNLREMGMSDFPDGGEYIGEDSSEAKATDDKLTFEKHEKLYLSSSVGSKPFKQETNQSYNRVLLDLLHDLRFHPLPMACVNRPEGDTVIDEHSSKVTIPYFEVHGPISTSIGDECLGCSRGWAHYCSVLQRRMPAVEHRAKLQPPLSSLMATRVGLGLRPRFNSAETTNSDDVREAADKPNGELFQWRDSKETKQLKGLPVVPSYSLDDPSERADDFVEFIEETTAMKVPEPPRPKHTDSSQHKKSGRVLPTQRHRDSSDGLDISGKVQVYNKCGRCRTIITNDTGCVQCRRAQLVINRSKRQPPGSLKGEGKMLKVHTAMLGRVQLKEGDIELQPRGDAAVAESILKERWTPSTILPPQKMPAPSPPHHLSTAYSDSEEELSNSSDENVEEPEDPERDLQSTDSDMVDLHVTRSGRPTRKAPLTQDSMEPMREAVLKQNKKEADELQKKVVQIAISGILLAMLRRDPLHLFAQPVSAEGYSAAIRNPIDFADVRLLCDNALAFNPPSSIYFKTAKDMHTVLAVMQKRATDWMGLIKDAHSRFLLRRSQTKRKKDLGHEYASNSDLSSVDEDPFDELRKEWPEAIQMLEKSDMLNRMIEADFMRTKENETAYYGAWAVRRTAEAAAASLASYPDKSGTHSVVAKRKHFEDERLRDHVDEKVAEIVFPIQLKDPSNWREEAVIRLMRKVQSKRLDRRTASENGCSRCDGAVVDAETKSALNADLTYPGKGRKKEDTDAPRVNPSRTLLRTGLGSAKTCQKIVSRSEEDVETSFDSVNDACVSVRGSRIHGMGLFADQPFKKGDCVAEYLGEYVTNPIADAREKVYGEQRIQDYQFRLDDKLVIDATTKGGPGRYINHNCSPNCEAKIIPGKEPNQHLRRVMIIAQRDIDPNEEITYDYQFPLELDMSARIPCHCQSDVCRGFMNWDLPEKGSNNRALLIQKRGANMRDRIRRLGRPLKNDV